VYLLIGVVVVWVHFEEVCLLSFCERCLRKGIKAAESLWHFELLFSLILWARDHGCCAQSLA
jgi:hypothetical protein